MSNPAPPRRFKPQPVETTTITRRKFVPEPTETSIRSTRKPAAGHGKSEPAPRESESEKSQPPKAKPERPKKFLPQPVEVSFSSNRHMPAKEAASKPRSKFSPQLIETTARSSREQSGVGPASERKPDAAPALEKPTEKPPAKRPARKFAPQCIETVKRSRRRGDTLPAVRSSDKTEATPEEHVPNPKRSSTLPLPVNPKDSRFCGRFVGSVGPPLLLVPKHGRPRLARRDSRGSNRSHSFRVPDLEPIESSQSEDDNFPSPSPSPTNSSFHSFAFRQAARMRESIDDRFSGCLLGLAARAAEKQLREQAMAAFANDDHHEPVDHYIDHEPEDSSDYLSSGRRSRRSIHFGRAKWVELRGSHHHHDSDGSRGKDRLHPASEQFARGRRMSKGPWANAAAALSTLNHPHGSSRNIAGGWQKDIGLEQMRNQARPPMLGGDIEFPRCDSPEPARFDVTQGSESVRESMCYLTQQAKQAEGDKQPRLWQERKNSSSHGYKASRTGAKTPPRGLWGGYCVGTATPRPPGMSGLLTPRAERHDPAETPPSTPSYFLPPTPPASTSEDIAAIDAKLMFEKSIEDEFSDEFVTQVYNYLSLGYPSLARQFDEELSKVSGISVLELRQDDDLASVRGYIRLGEDEDSKNPIVTEDMCMRWKALRLYIREWARQQPRMETGHHVMGGFGVAARRGSWAW